MRRVLLPKVASLIVVLLLVSFASFALTNLLPGNAATELLADTGLPPEDVAAARREFGLDRPVPVRYAMWLGRAVRGDLGESVRTGAPVTDLLRRRLPVTLQLVIAVQLVALLLAVPIGMWAAHRVDRWFDRALATGTFAVLALPSFVTAIVLLLVFSVRLRWFPASGYVRWSESVTGNLRSMVLPTFTMAVPLAAIYARTLRTDIAVTLAQDHVLLARAMGKPPRQVLFRHGLRQSSFTLLTLVGLQFASLIGGSLVIERIYSIPGMGSLMIEAIGSREHDIVQGGVLVIGIAYVTANFAIDLLRSTLDPRIRRQTPR